jgi:hypothetical protein
MRTKLIPLIVLFLFVFSANSQEKQTTHLQEIQNSENLVFKIFPTPNMYTFIKLDTRNGKIWQVQWGLENKYRFETILSDIPRAYGDEEKNGRFTLYSTTNSYNLLLLDQIDGRVWQVQWSLDAKDRGVMRIF